MAAKCKFYIYPGTKFISPYTNQPVNTISISKGYEEFEHPMFVATLTYAYPDRFITPLIYEMIGTYKRNKLVLPYDMHKIFGIEFVDRFIVATEAGKITNDGKAVTQSGSINIFTMQAYADPIKRILSQPIAPWSPVSVAPGKEYIVTGGICQSECEYSLMGVVDVWETKFNGTFLTRGGKQIELEGEGYERTVLIEFSSMDEAKSCYESDDYKQALEFIKKSAERLVVIVEGVA